MKNKFNTKHRGVQKARGPVAIPTFATIVYPALSLSKHLHNHKLWTRKT